MSFYLRLKSGVFDLCKCHVDLCKCEKSHFGWTTFFSEKRKSPLPAVFRIVSSFSAHGKRCEQTHLFLEDKTIFPQGRKKHVFLRKSILGFSILDIYKCPFLEKVHFMLEKTKKNAL